MRHRRSSIIRAAIRQRRMTATAPLPVSPKQQPRSSPTRCTNHRDPQPDPATPSPSAPRVVLEARRARPTVPRVIGARQRHRRRPHHPGRCTRPPAHSYRSSLVESVPAADKVNRTRCTNHRDPPPDPGDTVTDGAVASYLNAADAATGEAFPASSKHMPLTVRPVPSGPLYVPLEQLAIPESRVRPRRRPGNRMVVPTTRISRPSQNRRRRRSRRVVLKRCRSSRQPTRCRRYPCKYH